MTKKTSCAKLRELAEAAAAVTQLEDRYVPVAVGILEEVRDKAWNLLAAVTAAHRGKPTARSHAQVAQAGDYVRAIAAALFAVERRLADLGLGVASQRDERKTLDQVLQDEDARLAAERASRPTLDELLSDDAVRAD